MSRSDLSGSLRSLVLLLGWFDSVDLKSDGGLLGFDVLETGRLVELLVHLGLSVVFVGSNGKLNLLLRTGGGLVIRLNEERYGVLLEISHRSFLSSSLENDLLSLVWRWSKLGV